ncbi:hypothetical protein SAMN05660657_03198 [Geodermatophilus amargosae]|uniref:Uncharacterized protein n=1 Tax=Geodermatophilus amargosae TaxID=1296565 RepID=A0A1I7B052_9ACTN|nr:hypothetical protein SAMN05660657_03198 [Geodermatophilus amargosae]
MSASRAEYPTYRVTFSDERSWLTSGDYRLSAPNFRKHSLRPPVSPAVLTIGARQRIPRMTRPEELSDPGDSGSDKMSRGWTDCMDQAARSPSPGR